MAFMPNLRTTLLLLPIFVVLLPVETYAFGAGDIPDFAYLNDKAFRHGDIESILENLVKNAGGVATGGGLLSFAHSMLKQASGGAKFTKSDTKKVYFGNWLRDYSQCMDIAGLSKLTADTLVLIVSVLGFVTFGFATEEFQVTVDRLGVYLPVEHIDNPKGYAEKEGDARNFHPNLRPPVDSRELEIDERTGMKDYMATEDQGWDTSTAFIRRTFRACIEAGRRAEGQDGADLWEAYRLLGTGLHTMEDLLAHSNWCEVALRKLGHEEVFCHVGDNVIINTPNGSAPPLITGTFGGADFIYSLMGEATDKLSQASVTEITQKMDQAGDSESNIGKLKAILSKLPIGGGDDEVSQGEEMNAAAKAYNFDPDNVAPPEVQRQLFQLLKWRDSVYREIVAKIDMIPGLADLLDDLANALNAYVYTILSPYIVPLLQQATAVLGEGSKSVIDSEDQYEVFDNPDASDPSHSFLSKDHFDLILNEPAGKIAQLVVENSVNLIVQAWASDNDPDEVITQILEAFHHPYYATGRSEIQRQMFDHMDRWIDGLGHEEATEIIQRLTKDSVRNARNKRPGSEDHSHDESADYGGHSHNHGGTYASGGHQNSQGQSQYDGNHTDTSNTDTSNDSRYGSSNQYSSDIRYSSVSQYGSNEYSSGDQRDSSNRYNSDNQYGSSGKHYKSIAHYSSSNQYGSSGKESIFSDQYGSSNQHGPSDTYGSRRNNEEGGYNISRNEYPSDSPSYGESQPHGYDQVESRRSGYSSGYVGRTESHHGESENYHDERHTLNDEDDRNRRYGRDNEYGRDASYQHEEERFGGGRDEDDPRTSYDQPDYSVNRYESRDTTYNGSQEEEGYGSRRPDNENSSGYNESYGSGGHHEKHERKEHRRQNSSNDSDNDQRYNKWSVQESDAPYGGGYVGERPQARSYGGFGYEDETYGVERMRVKDDNEEEEEEEKKRRHHHHRKRDSDSS